MQNVLANLLAAIGVPAGVFGGVSVITYIRRGWSLSRSNSTSRPINGTRWSFDYFQYNFTLGLVYVTALVSYATSTKPANPRIAALPLSLLVAQVCSQLLVVCILSSAGIAYPFTASSMEKGTRPIRPALYTIIEDVVSVDGGGGTAFRTSWDSRYQCSPDTRALLGHLSLFWGCSGLTMSAAVMVAIFVVPNADVSWALGMSFSTDFELYHSDLRSAWTVPWAWAAIMAIITKFWTKRALAFHT